MEFKAYNVKKKPMQIGRQTNISFIDHNDNDGEEAFPTKKNVCMKIE